MPPSPPWIVRKDERATRGDRSCLHDGHAEVWLRDLRAAGNLESPEALVVLWSVAGGEMTYRTIVADPPWAYDEGFAYKDGDEFHQQALPYGSMELEEILALPIRALADPKGCALFLWTTNRYLADAFDVLGAWGFRYRQTIVWHKTNAQPVGGSVAPNAEFLLVSRRGPHTWHGPRWPSAVISAPRSEHSRKPEVFLDLVESISPPPYVELFARRNRFGWDTWGNQSLEIAEVA
jgi:N6-adenosine-specific RNA methylase IME4